MNNLNWSFLDKKTIVFIVTEMPEKELKKGMLGTYPNLPESLRKERQHPAQYLNAQFVKTLRSKYVINLYSYIEDYMMDNLHTLVEILRDQSVIYIRWCENPDKVFNFIDEYGYQGITKILQY